VEIFELLFALVQGCGCFLEIMALGTNAGAGYAGVKARRTGQQRRAARERGEPDAPYNGWFWLFVLLLSLGLGLLGLTIWKYAR
jgi:hypothetical protein